MKKVKGIPIPYQIKHALHFIVSVVPKINNETMEQ